MVQIVKSKEDYMTEDLGWPHYTEKLMEMTFEKPKVKRKPIVYVDMDGVLCDIETARLQAKKNNPEIVYPQSQYGFFKNLTPMSGGINFMWQMEDLFDLYIATRPSYKNPLCYTEKRIWVEEWLGTRFVEKLIIIPNKSLLIGDYLIDNEVWDFKGEQILFGSNDFPNWQSVIKYMKFRYAYN